MHDVPPSKMHPYSTPTKFQATELVKHSVFHLAMVADGSTVFSIPLGHPYSLASGAAHVMDTKMVVENSPDHLLEKS
jgi:hypothetical protein